MILKITRIDTDQIPVVEVWDKVSHLRWEEKAKPRREFQPGLSDGPKNTGIQFIFGDEPPMPDQGMFYQVDFESWGMHHTLAVHEGYMYLCNDEGETVDKMVFREDTTPVPEAIPAGA